MATPIATPNWRIQFQRQSTTDQRIFTITEPVDELNSDDVKVIMAELKRQGFVNIAMTLVVVIP